MNIKQAKQRFEELTELSAYSHNVIYGIWQAGGYVDHWQQYAWDNGYCKAVFNAKTTGYWVSIAKYLESLGGDK